MTENISVMKKSWMDRLHDKSVYEGFPIEEWPKDIQGWGADSPIFEEIIKTRKPTVVIEVGSWKGASAIEMARCLKKYDCAAEIICVDTWLGDGEVVPKLWGRPVLYEQFIANVIYTENTDIIVPLAADSLASSILLGNLGMQADAIYIDAGHDYQNCINDISRYWSLLRPGGIMFGDDYSLAWPEVVRAVHEFADQQRLQVWPNFVNKWYLGKPS